MSARAPRRATDPRAVLELLHLCFAGMEGRIDPPSSLHRLTEADVAAAEVWVLGDPVVACVFLTPRAGALYLGKLAVHPDHQGRGLARALLDHAAARARTLGLPALELQTRVELVENHAAFRAMGFEKVGETTHDGFDHPTSLTFRKPVQTGSQ